MPANVRNHLEKKMVGNRIREFCIKDVLGSGNTAVTYEVEDNFGVTWALKLVTSESYGNSAKIKEVIRFNQIEDERYVVFPKETGEWTLEISEKIYTFYWFKSRCVRGKTFNQFLHSENKFSAKDEISRYIDNIATALELLRKHGFCHGDFHDKNLMREEVGVNGPTPEIRYVIIDFSEAHSNKDPKAGLSKDIENYGKHLRSFYDNVSQRESISREDEKILTAISHLPGMISGNAPEIMGILKATDVRDLFVKAISSIKNAPNKLTSPFEPVSAEYIANDKLLTSLCYTGASWVKDLENNSNIVLTGPRGSGKTMIFRRLRLKTKILANKKDEILKDNYAGFYLPCESLFFMRFSNLTESDVEEYIGSLIVYFNMAVLSEVCSTINLLPTYLHPISQGIASSISLLVKQEVDDLWDLVNGSNSLVSLSELVECADQMMRRVQKSIALGEKLDIKGSTNFVYDLVKLVKKKIPYLTNRSFNFFGSSHN